MPVGPDSDVFTKLIMHQATQETVKPPSNPRIIMSFCVPFKEIFISLIANDHWLSKFLSWKFLILTLRNSANWNNEIFLNKTIINYNILSETYYALYVSACNPYSHAMKMKLACAPFYRGNWGTERWSTLPKATQLGRGWGRIWTQAMWLSRAHIHNHSAHYLSDIYLPRTDGYCLNAGT